MMSTVPFLINRQIGLKSKAGKFGCSLNLDNVISRLVCYKKDVFAIQGEETEVPPFVCKFRRDAQSHLLAVCNEDGYILLYDTSKKHEDALVQSFLAHNNAIFDISWVPDRGNLISGSGDHLAVLWDMSYYKCINRFKHHTASIKSVDICCEQSSIFATGSRDGNINIWDTRIGGTSGFSKPVITILRAHGRKNTVYRGRKAVQKDPISSVSAVAFQDVNNIASAGVADGVVKIWDLRRTYVADSRYYPSPRYQMEYSKFGNTGPGCSSLVFDSQFKTLYACSTRNKIFKFDCHSYVKKADIYDGFICSTYFVKLDLSSDDQYLVCGSSDDKAYIWKTSKPGLPIVQLAGHSAEVTSVCWSPYDVTKLATCGDDFKVAIWKVADTETISLNENIHAIVEAYQADPKNSHSSPPLQDIAENSTTASKSMKKSRNLIQTPSKSAIKDITTFFSPITPTQESAVPLTSIENLSYQDDGNAKKNSLLSPASRPTNKNIVATPLVIKNCNSVNKNNFSHISANNNFNEQMPLGRNYGPEQKRIVTSFSITYPAIHDKENASVNISPETPCILNDSSQSKRKVLLNNSSLIVKRRRTESFKKSKRIVNLDQVTKKTIKDYFSASCSTDTQ